MSDQRVSVLAHYHRKPSSRVNVELLVSPTVLQRYKDVYGDQYKARMTFVLMRHWHDVPLDVQRGLVKP